MKLLDRIKSFFGINNTSNDKDLLKETKNKALEECFEYLADCDNLLCSISKTPLEDPVITPAGEFYDRAFILEWLSTNSTCPLTRAPLTAEQLVNDTKLTMYAENLENERVKLKHQLSHAKNNEDITMHVSIFKTQIDTLGELFSLYQEEIKNDIRKEKLRQDISQIKIRLKLDKNNPEDLKYWDAKCSFKFMAWAGHGGTEIQSEQQSFRIPSGVKKMMDIVTDENLGNYNNVDECYEALKAARAGRSRLGLFKKIYRAQAATYLYKHDLEKLRLNF